VGDDGAGHLGAVLVGPVAALRGVELAGDGTAESGWAVSIWESITATRTLGGGCRCGATFDFSAVTKVVGDFRFALAGFLFLAFCGGLYFSAAGLPRLLSLLRHDEGRPRRFGICGAEGGPRHARPVARLQGAGRVRAVCAAWTRHVRRLVGGIQRRDRCRYREPRASPGP
jgi:hypothetical protein